MARAAQVANLARVESLVDQLPSFVDVGERAADAAEIHAHDVGWGAGGLLSYLILS